MPTDLLYLVHRTPFPPNKGDRIRAYHILRFLSQRCRVHLACLADEPVEPEVEAKLRSLCADVAIHPLGKSRWLRAFGSLVRGRSITEGAFWSPALAQTLRNWCSATKFTAALASASSMVPYLRLAELQKAPAVVDLVDVDSQKWLDYSASRLWPLSQLYATEGKRLRHLESGLPSWTRGVTLVSDAEANLYKTFAEAGPVHAVTNGVDLEYYAPPAAPTAEQGCVFVGAMDYFPNIDAALWFCRNVWPRIGRAVPQARFRIVGRRPAPAVCKLVAVPGVEIVADMPDVRPYLQQAAVVVVPLRIARGLQNKVIEALAMGKAVVASPPATAALRTCAGVHLLTASTPQEWTDAILTLLNDPAMRRTLGAAGRTFVENEHDWERCLEPLTRLLGIPDVRNDHEATPAGEATRRAHAGVC